MATFKGGRSAAIGGFGLYLLTKVPCEPSEADTQRVAYYLVGGILVLAIGASTIGTGWRFRKAGQAHASDRERLVAALRALSGTLGWPILFCVVPFCLVLSSIVVMAVIRLLQ